MANSKVAIRYALSFLDASIENNSIEKVSEDFELVYNSIRGSKDLKVALKSPVIKSETKKSVIKDIFGNKISKDALSFLDFVVNKGRESFLDEILENYFKLKDEHFGIANVQVTTVFELTIEQKELLKQRFESLLNKKVRLNYIIDEKILGGFLARVDDTVYDASMAHQLELLKKQFLNGSLTLN